MIEKLQINDENSSNNENGSSKVEDGSWLFKEPEKTNNLTINPFNSNAKVDDPIAVQRFKDCYDELVKLDKNWNSIATNGDNIRRILGTVYSPPVCTSPLCSSEIFINKFVKNHINDLDYDLFDQSSSLYLQALNQADFLAYSSIFANYGNGGGTTDYISESHKQILNAIQHLFEMIKVIDQ